MVRVDAAWVITFVPYNQAIQICWSQTICFHKDHAMKACCTSLISDKNIPSRPDTSRATMILARCIKFHIPPIFFTAIPSRGATGKDSPMFGN